MKRVAAARLFAVRDTLTTLLDHFMYRVREAEALHVLPPNSWTWLVFGRAVGGDRRIYAAVVVSRTWTSLLHGAAARHDASLPPRREQR